jgi:hypothetical protein
MKVSHGITVTLQTCVTIERSGEGHALARRLDYECLTRKGFFVDALCLRFKAQVSGLLNTGHDMLASVGRHPQYDYQPGPSLIGTHGYSSLAEPF